MFHGLSAEGLLAIAERTAVRRFEAGESLLRQDEPGDALWMIATGTAVVRLHRRGGVTRELARVGPGDVVGEMALVTGAPRNADVVAVTPGTALVLERSAFEQVAAVHTDVIDLLTELTAARLGRAVDDGLGDKVLEGYRILRPVGRGATAVVYEAEQVATRRRTALKMMSHRLARDLGAMEWFEREGNVLEEVAHDGVAGSWGRFHAYGTCFLAIEYIDGVSAHEIVRRTGPMEIGDALAVAGSVAAALGHVHTRRVVHRDVKPANVMVGRNGRVVLTDFGIASHVDAAKDDPRTAVRVRGTPNYMAPELFVGATPSPATDLYALGCVLFELIEGRPPFAEKELGMLILSKRRFETPAAGAMRAEVPESVRHLIGRLVAPDPSARGGAADLAPARVAPDVVAEVLRLRGPGEPPPLSTTKFPRS